MPGLTTEVNRPLVLVDAMNVAYRSHYAFQDLHDSNNRPTGVIYGFLKALMDLQERYSERIVICWDCPKGWRRGASTVYKSNRKLAPEDNSRKIVFQQVKVLKKFFRDVLGMHNASSVGLEADDVMSIAASDDFSVVPTYLFTSDRDLYQVLRHDHCTVVRLVKGKMQEIRKADVLGEYGILPIKWPVYLAAGGDQSDGLKAFPGVGPKTALALVRAGLKPEGSFSEQPEAVQKKLKRHEANWSDLLAVWRLVRLPSFPASGFIPDQAGRVAAHKMLEAIRQYHRLKVPDGVERFTAFCADYEMPTLLHKRRQFLNW